MQVMPELKEERRHHARFHVREGAYAFIASNVSFRLRGLSFVQVFWITCIQRFNACAFSGLYSLLNNCSKYLSNILVSLYEILGL